MLNIKYENSQSEYKTLSIDGKYVHSKYHPERECESVSFPKKSIILIFGTGIGYGVKNLIKNNKNSIFIVYEPIKELVQNIVEIISLEFCNQRNNILIINEQNDAIIYDFISKHDRNGDYRLQTHFNRVYSDIFASESEILLASVKRSYELNIQNILTESNFSYLWTKNFIYNASRLDKTKLIAVKPIEARDNIAVVVCAGPTLDNDISIIKENHQNITIFAVDTAIKPLLSANITPDFVISLDGQIYSLDDFTLSLSDTTTIIADILAYPAIPRYFDNTYFVVTDNSYRSNIAESFLSRLNISESDIDPISVSGTVSDFAMRIASRLGFKHIFFAGLDLSYPKLTTHCRQTPLYNKLWRESTYFSGIETRFCDIISKRNIKSVISKQNHHILSDFVLDNYAAGFTQFATTHKDMHLINSLSDGLAISGLQNAHLIDVIRKYESQNIKDTIEQTLKESVIKINSHDIDKVKTDIISIIYEFTNKIKNLFEKSDYSDNTNVNEWICLYTDLYNALPFMRKFVIMTEMILSRKQITSDMSIFYKHTAFKLLQSSYFVIRTLQK